MASDLNIIQSTVIALQGNAVSSSSPTDGYVLTWNTANNEWEPRPLPAATGLRVDTFTSSGSWVCPAGVTNVLVIAMGGGGGGCGGRGDVNAGSAGGGGAIQQASYMSTTPSTSYTVNYP